MVTESELMRHRRVLFVGPYDSGKTYAAVNIANYYAATGRKVLYVGIEERSADIELLKRARSNLANIDYTNFDNRSTRSDFMTLMNKLEAADRGSYQLVVVDPVHHIKTFCREHIRNELLKQGWYLVPVKKEGHVPTAITNRATFELAGIEFAKSNNAEARLLRAISNGNFHCVITMTESIIKEPETVLSLADVIIETYPRGQKEGRRIRMTKNRAEDNDCMPEEFGQGMDLVPYLFKHGIDLT